MKIRHDFVTNSSSSSFLISKKFLDDDQLEAIRQHSKLGKALDIEYSDEAWDIDENEGFITGYTFMDNFNMREFFTKIGINMVAVTWGEFMFNLPSDEKEELYPKDKNPSEWRDILHNITDD